MTRLEQELGSIGLYGGVSKEDADTLSAAARLDAQHKNTQMQKEMDILSKMLWDRDTELDQLKAVTDPMVCDECNGVGEVPKGAKHFYEVDMKPCPICKIPRPSNQSQDMGKDDNKCGKCGNIAMPGGRHYCEMYNKGKDGAK